MNDGMMMSNGVMWGMMGGMGLVWLLVVAVLVLSVVVLAKYLRSKPRDDHGGRHPGSGR